MKFEIGQRIECVNSTPLRGNDVAPAVKVGKTYYIANIVEDSKGNQHLDVGLPSSVNYVRSFETKEELPKGNIIHWCHPSRFVIVNEL